MILQIDLPPITKKNHQQIIYCKGRPMVIPSKQYKQYEKDCGWFLSRYDYIEPINYPCNVKCLYYMPTRRRVDLNNLLEATTDILVHYGVLEDDNSNIIKAFDGSRVLYDKKHPRTVIEIEVFDEE